MSEQKPMDSIRPEKILKLKVYPRLDVLSVEAAAAPFCCRLR